MLSYRKTLPCILRSQLPLGLLICRSQLTLGLSILRSQSALGLAAKWDFTQVFTQVLMVTRAAGETRAGKKNPFHLQSQ